MKFLQANALSFLCLALMFVAAVLLFEGLPETIPMQYSLDGIAGNPMPKLAAILVLPCSYAASILGINVMVHYSPEKFSLPNSKRAMDIVILGVGLLLLAVHIGIMRALGDTQILQQYLSIGLALFLVVTGNVFGKVERNFFVGIRLPWTIASMQNWKATHRFAGRLMVVSGLLLIVASFYQPAFALTMILGFSWALLSIVYSFLFYLKNERPASE